MSSRIKVEMKPVNTILTNLGVNKTGRVQSFLTNTINRRITAYMPYRTNFLSTKAKFIKSPTEIEVLAPYARVMYYPNVMVNAKTGKGPADIPGVGYRFPKGSVLKPSDRKWDYSTEHNPKAGPFWDKRLMAAERKSIAQEVQNFARRQK